MVISYSTLNIGPYIISLPPAPAGKPKSRPWANLSGKMSHQSGAFEPKLFRFHDVLPPTGALIRLDQDCERPVGQGITLDRSTLSNWVGTACWWLTPIYDLLVATVLSSPKVFADDTSRNVTSIPDLRTDTASREAVRRLDDAHKLLDEVHYMLTEMRRELLGSGRRPGQL